MTLYVRFPELMPVIAETLGVSLANLYRTPAEKEAGR